MTRFAILAVLALAATAAAAQTRWHQLKGYTGAHYEAEFGKSYATAEERTWRLALVEKRLHAMRAHNADDTKTWKEGVNHLTDRTIAEFKQLLGYDKHFGYANHFPQTGMFQIDQRAAIDVLPTNVDWRSEGIVSPVKNQGECGSCWSFATAETIESHYAKATGIISVVSEQHVLDCVPNPEKCGGTGGCEGGTAELAYAWFAANGTAGVSSEWTYPYVSFYGKDMACRTDVDAANKIKVTGYTKLPANQYVPLMTAVANNGPIAISVEAIHWSAYESGVFNGCNQTHPDIDHAVQLVGYGSDAANGDYWLVRNSWSPFWGEKGYIRVARTANEESRCGVDVSPADGSGCAHGPKTVKACGTCAILFDTCYPTITA